MPRHMLCSMHRGVKMIEVDIQTIRKSLKLTQAELAEKLGVDVITVSRWERKKTKPSNLAKRQLRRLEVKNGDNS